MHARTNATVARGNPKQQHGQIRHHRVGHWPLMPRRAPMRVLAAAKKDANDADASSTTAATRLASTAAAGLLLFSAGVGVGVGASGAVAAALGARDPPPAVTTASPISLPTAATSLAPSKPAPPLAAAPPTPEASADAAAAAAKRRGLSAEEQATIRVFEENTPSVVNITNLQRVRFVGGGGGGGGSSSATVPVGTGSGFFWPAPDGRPGVVVTNYHVVRGAAAIRVALYDQSTYNATLVGADPEKDVAVLQLQGLTPARAAALRPVVLGSSSDLAVGQRVLAIGNPFGLDHSLSVGVVSGLNREIGAGGEGGGGGMGGASIIRGAIQIDAAVNPGNSGGISTDSQGRVVGINTAIADPTGKGSSSGVGFALPIDSVKGLVGQILEYGRVVRPALGITIAPPQALRQLGIEGVLIYDAPEGGPAARAGLRATVRDPQTGAVRLGDVIVAIDGAPVRNFGDLYRALDDRRVGDEVEVEVLRDLRVEQQQLQAGGGGGGGVIKAERGSVRLKLGERASVGAPALASAGE
jgi:S1-C subfamily serine protease